MNILLIREYYDGLHIEMLTILSCVPVKDSLHVEINYIRAGG